MSPWETAEATRNATPADVADTATQPPRSWRGLAVRALLGAGLLAFLLHRFGGSAVLTLLARERLGYFAAVVAIYIAGQVMSAYRWRLVATVVSIRAPFREFVAYYFIGVFTNLFVPGLVGGDAARALYLGRSHGRLGPAAASALADRGAGFLVVLWFAAGAAWWLNDGMLPPSVTTPTIAIGVLALAGYLAFPLIARLEKFMPHRMVRYAAMITPYLHRPAALIPAMILSLVLQVSLVVGQYILALGLGLSIPFSIFFLCVPIAGVFASLPLTLNGLGVREGAYAVLFGMAGVASADAVALGLLYFAASMVVGLTGVIPFLTTPTPALRRASAVRSGS
jgi:glycosyltransferase 2 family protein